MHAFSHLISRTRSKLIHWTVTSMNSIEKDINNLELEIVEAEANDVLSDHSNHPNMDLVALYDRLPTL